MMMIAESAVVAAGVGRELVAEYEGRAEAVAAREALEEHGVAHGHVKLEAAPADAGYLGRATLRFDRSTVRRVGSWSLLGTAAGAVTGVVAVAVGIGVFAATGAPIGVNAAIALLLGGTGGAEAGAFIGATASLPALASINADLLASAEPHVFLRISPVVDDEADAAISALPETRPEHVRRLAGAVAA
jgi:hypothetical protein